MSLLLDERYSKANRKLFDTLNARVKKEALGLGFKIVRAGHEPYFDHASISQHIVSLLVKKKNLDFLAEKKDGKEEFVVIGMEENGDKHVYASCYSDKNMAEAFAVSLNAIGRDESITDQISVYQELWQEKTQTGQKCLNDLKGLIDSMNLNANILHGVCNDCKN